MVVNAARFVYRTLPRQQPPIAIRGSQPSHSTEALVSTLLAGVVCGCIRVGAKRRYTYVSKIKTNPIICFCLSVLWFLALELLFLVFISLL